MQGCFENPFVSDTSLDPRPLPSPHMRTRYSALSLRHPPEHPPIMQESVGTQSPSSVGFSAGFGFGELSKCRSDGGIENDAVCISLPFVHCKAFS